MWERGYLKIIIDNLFIIPLENKNYIDLKY